MSNPTFSVILPTYNRCQRLSLSIDSVMQQTVQDYELIIIDDASTDDTLSWLRQTYPADRYPQIRLLPLSQNRGAAGARNAGIEIAQGDWIAFLDSDDQWLPPCLEHHAAAIADHPSASFSACDGYSLWRNRHTHQISEQKIVIQSKPWSIYPNATHHMLMSPMILTMSLVVANRQKLLQLGGLNEALRICHDRELYLRLLQIGDYVHVPHPLVLRIQEADSLTQNMRRYAQETLQVVDYFLATSGGSAYQHLRRSAKSRWCMNAARKLLDENQDRQFAYYLLMQALWFSPALVWNAMQRRL